jgi:hypothetical protein
VLRHSHLHGLNVCRATQEGKALPQGSRHAIRKGVTVAIKVLNVGIFRYGDVLVILPQQLREP